MDIGLVGNLLLFLGALGASLFANLDSSTEDTAESDPLYDATDYSKTENGGSGADTEVADQDSIAWFTGGGDDAVTGSNTNDYANLGSGNDRAALQGGNDIALGGTGNDTIDGGGGTDQIYGGAGSDNLFGNIGDDGIDAGDGNDVLSGGSGSDILRGGAGDDTISGYSATAAGANGLTGVEGADQLIGGDGMDRLIMGRGDLAQGGSGADTFVLDNRWTDSTAQYQITDFIRGTDRLELTYIPRLDVDTNVEVPPTLTFNTTADGNTELSINGSVVALLEGVTGMTAADVALRPDSTTDTSYNASRYSEVVTGTDSADIDTNNTTASAYFMGAGADTITGSGFADYFRMGDGADLVDAGAGADMIHTEAGDDRVLGGAGLDTILGGAGADSLYGGADADRIAGELGDDNLIGGSGSDYIAGGAGNDTISGYTDTGGADGTLTAIDGVDTLLGGEGLDTLLMGVGDTAAGGAGADTFRLDYRYQEAAQVATVQDFATGTDRLELTYTPVYNAAGIEIAPVVTVALSPDSAYTIVRVDGDSVVHLTGVRGFTVADVILRRG